MADTNAHPPMPEPDVPQSFDAPPTGAGPRAIPPAESTWVRVIGIIGIVYASLNLLGGVCGLGMAGVYSGMDGIADDVEPLYEMFTSWGPWMAVHMIVDMLLTGVLLAGAIGLLKHRLWSRRLLMGWAVASILVGGLGLIITYAMSTGTVSLPPAGAPGTWEIGFLGVLVFSICFGILWSWGPSIFTLVWFSRARIKAEVAGWSGPGA